MNRREQRLSGARGCPDAVPLGCYLSYLSSNTTGCASLWPLQLTRAVSAGSGLRKQRTFSMVIKPHQNSSLRIQGRTSDVIFMEERLKHEGSSSQWLTHVMNLTLDSVAICRSKPAKPKLCITWELEEAESVLPKTNKRVCWNLQTPRLSVDKLLVVTPITMAVWRRLNVLSQTDVALCSSRKPRGRAAGVSHSVNTDAAAVLPRRRLK